MENTIKIVMVAGGDLGLYADECGTCNGTGYLYDDLMEREEMCPDCKGKGKSK